MLRTTLPLKVPGAIGVSVPSTLSVRLLPSGATTCAPCAMVSEPRSVVLSTVQVVPESTDLDEVQAASASTLAIDSTCSMGRIVLMNHSPEVIRTLWGYTGSDGMPQRSVSVSECNDGGDSISEECSRGLQI